MTPTCLADLWSGLQKSPDSPFLDTPTGAMSRGELAQLVRGFCARFREANLSDGDRILILCADEMSAIAGFVAAVLDGLVPVMLTPDTPTARAASIAASVEATAVLIDAHRASEPWVAAARCRLVHDGSARPHRRWWMLGSARPADRVAASLALQDKGVEPRLPADMERLAYLLFTSGTTQAPSGVMITRANLLANVATIARVLDVDTSSRVFNDMVLAHGDGLVQGPMLALATGSCLVRAGGFSIQGMEDWLNRVRAAGATHLITVPTVWKLIDQFAAHDDYFSDPQFRHLSSVAAGLDEGLWRRLETRFGRPVTNQYGLTETVASAIYAGPHPDAGAIGTIGRPIDCEARIAPERDVAGVGELQLRGANVFRGYWQDEARTRASFTDDGWMRTGDLGRLRGDGSFEILGRLKTVIMCGGFLIRPEEIDEVLRAHPAVLDSVTVSMPDEHFDEVPMTAVVLKVGQDEVTTNDLSAHARARLEALKLPRRIAILVDMPRGISGKPNLAAVREALAVAGTVPQVAGGVTTEDRVLDVAAEVFRMDRQALDLGMGPGDLGAWDSFTHVSLLFALEKQFGIRIPTARAVSIRTLKQAVAVVDELA